MSTNNHILACDSSPEIINLSQGIPVINEQQIMPLPNNSSSSQEPQNPEAERILSHIAQQPIVRESNQKDQESKTRMFACKTLKLFLIDCLIKIMFILIQYFMLGFFATLICLGFGLGFYVLAVVLLLCEYFRSNLNQSSFQCPRFFFKVSFLGPIGTFILSICYPVRYTFNNPEAFDIEKVYTSWYNESHPDYYEDESSDNSSLKSIDLVYYLQDMCQEIFKNSVDDELEQSSYYYCHKLMDGIIQDNNFQNLHSVQIVIMVLFGLTLIFQFLIVYLQLKNTKQYLSFFPIPPPLNDSEFS